MAESITFNMVRDKLNLYKKIDEGRRLDFNAMISGSSPYPSRLRRHGEIYNLAGDDLRKFLRRPEQLLPAIPSSSRTVGDHLALTFKLIMETISIYNSIDAGNGLEFANAIDLDGINLSPYASALRRHAMIYALADAPLWSYLRRRSELQRMELLDKLKNYRILSHSSWSWSHLQIGFVVVVDVCNPSSHVLKRL
jgi:hypothetical protein